MRRENWLMVLALPIAMPQVVREAWSAGASGAWEQSKFSAEAYTFKRPVRVPSDALQLLRNDGHVLSSLKTENLKGDQLPIEWFTASEIHLDGPHEVDLLVMGVDRLRGANVSPFWIFRKTPDGYQLVLNAPAHELEVLTTRSKGFRNIRAFSLTANTVLTITYRFDGRQYQPQERKSEPVE